MSRRTLPVALSLLAVLLPLPTVLTAQAFLVEDIETEAIPLPDPECPLSSHCVVFGSLPQQLTPFGDLLAFTAFESESGRELWVSDGTEAGTRQVADLAPGEAGSLPDLLGVSENGLVFCARTDPDPQATTCHLFVTGGDPAVGVTPLGLTDAREPAAVQDGFVYFQRFDEELGGHVLWRTDGTPGGTEVVHDLCPFPADHPDRDDCDALLIDLVSHAGSLYLVTSYTDLDDPERRTLQRLDRLAGLSEGPGLSAELEPEILYQHDPIHEVTPFRGGVLFVVHRPFFPSPETFLLAFFDGQEVLELGGFDEVPTSLTVAGDLAYFQVLTDAADTPPHPPVTGRIWRTDGTPEGTAEHILVPGFDPTGAEDRLFFIFDERTHPPGNLWLAVTDEDGEVTLLDRPAFLPLTAIGRRVFFSGQTSNGTEPRTSDGTEEGTHGLGDLAPGVASSNPAGYTRVGDLVFFVAENAEVGRELWAVRLSELPEIPDPEPPYDEWIDSPLYPDFRFQARISPSAGTTFQGREEDDCQPETVCVSGALPGRSEAFLRILGPRGNGFYWPTVVRFTPSRVEVWIERVATGARRYYRLEAVPPGTEDLPGLQDRRGFPAG